MKKELDEIRSKFSEAHLKGALNTDEQFDGLKTVRKQLTQFQVASAKTLKAAHLQTTTKKHYICHIQKTLIPNKFHQDTLDQIDNEIDKFASKINADLCSQILADTQNIMRNTQQVISTEDKLIIYAKSWRSIKISQKRQQQTYRQYEENDRYKPRRRSTYVDRHRTDDKEKRVRPSYHDEQNYHDRDRRRYVPSYHDEQNQDDRDRRRYPPQTHYRERRKRSYYQDEQYDDQREKGRIAPQTYYRQYRNSNQDRKRFERGRWYDENFPLLRHSTKNNRYPKN